MNKTIIININSIVFHIEEEAYEVLRTYMIDIKRHFVKSSDSQEILQDIENRIAEMFTEKIHIGRKEVISNEDVEDVISRMGRVSDFENEDHNETLDGDDKQTYQDTVSRKLMRNPDDKILGGVCSGLGAYFGLDAKWMRIIFLCFFFFGGTGVMLYIILWIVMPVASTRADKMAMKGESPNLQNFKKSFDEEVKTFEPHLSKAKGVFKDGANSIGDIILKCIQLFGRFFGFCVLIFCGLTLFGLTIGSLGFISGILGFQNEMVFPGTEILSTIHGILAIIAGTLAIGIPFFALFHVFMRVLFGTKPMNNYLSLGLWATWIVSIMAILFFVFIGAKEFKESSTIKVEKALGESKVYYITQKDVRLIEASSSDKEEKRFKVEYNGENLESSLRNEISVRFESIDSLAKPYIRYDYFSKGRTYQVATENAANINYLARQDGDKVIFNSHFNINPSNKYRGQYVTATICLPAGSKVMIDKSIARKISGISNRDCSKQYSDDEDIKATEWIMGSSTLLCTPKFLPVSSKETIHEEVENTIVEDISETKKVEEEVAL